MCSRRETCSDPDRENYNWHGAYAKGEMRIRRGFKREEAIERQAKPTKGKSKAKARQGGAGAKARRRARRQGKAKEQASQDHKLATRLLEEIFANE